ncbi:MAG: alpha/beta hydrolase family protein [Puniceicoccales bacterium]
MLTDLRNPQGERLDSTFHPGADGARKIVVLGHGVTGNKDRPLLVALAEAIAAKGLPCLRVSFSGNGDSEGRFEDSTITKEVADLAAVLAESKKHFDEIAYIGHSMGGAVGVIATTSGQPINTLISVAGMVHIKEFADTEFGAEKRGFMWEEEDCPLSQTYLDDCAQWGSIVERGAQVNVPWLLIHGEPDDVVPIHHSRDIITRAGGNARLIEVPAANHVFSGDAETLLVDAVAPWLEANF